jgi:ankyrin repeat protein
MSKNEDFPEQDLFELHFAAQDGDLVKVKELVAKGSSVNSFDDISHTPLHYAAEKENLDVVKFLIESGADVNIYEEEKIGNTPLREIAESCSYEMAKLLVDAGANPLIPGWMKITALDKAAKRKKPEGQHVYQLLKNASDKFRLKYPDEYLRHE